MAGDAGLTPKNKPKKQAQNQAPKTKPQNQAQKTKPRRKSTESVKWSIITMILKLS